MTKLDSATIAALLKKADEPKSVNQAPSREGLVWCEFCKGYYNEHHYGREVDE